MRVSTLTTSQSLGANASLLTDSRCDHLTLNWAALRYKHAAAIRACLAERYAPATANKMLSALRRVLKEALRLELLDAADYARAVDFKTIKVSSELRGRALEQSEIAALLEVARSDRTPIGFRDAALIAILRGAGVRRAEVVSLDLKDFNPSTGALKIRKGKGRKERTVYLPLKLISVVEDWIEIRGQQAGPLLCPINKGGRVLLSRLTPQAVLYLLQKRATEALVDPFSPHDFRRTFASDLLDAGTDISTVQKLMGHSSVGTTVKYDRRGEETLRRAVQVLDLLGL